MSPTALHGKLAVIEINAVAITGVTDISGFGIGDAPVADTTAMGDTAQSSLKGIPGGGTWSLTGFMPAGTQDHGGLPTLAKAAGTTPVTFEYYPAGVAAPGTTGTCHVQSFTQSANFGGACMWQASGTITGAVTFEAV